MDMKELRDMEVAELAEKERQLTQEVFNLRFQLATGRIENPMRIRQTRRDLARVKTIMEQKISAGGKPTSQNKG
ncbi:MAG: 50S ribosomal protein L29 [Nitrospirae bacterium]|nr:50S ribosomal protein L29 [Nitrospirota bacterium]